MNHNHFAKRAALFTIFAVLVFGLPSFAFADEVDQVVKVVSDDWSSLEIVKLFVELLLPVAMLLFGLWLDRRIKDVEHRQWSNQKVIEKRLEVYEKMAPKLNEMMCYFMRIGSWKDQDPVSVVDIKRELDKTAHIYAPLFSTRFLEAYNAYMNKCFVTERGEGKDAALRAELQHYCEFYVGVDHSCQWKPEWDEYFTDADHATDRFNVREAYQELMAVIAAELGVGIDPNQNDQQATGKAS